MLRTGERQVILMMNMGRNNVSRIEMHGGSSIVRMRRIVNMINLTLVLISWANKIESWFTMINNMID